MNAARSPSAYLALGAIALFSLLPMCRAATSTCAAEPCKAPPGSGFDVIVVGSGAGGGPLASRLARSGKRVLLLEAGEDVGGELKYQVPAMHALATEDPAMAWWFFVKHHADSAVDAEDSKHTKDGILYPRGSALGGSTAVNAMVSVLPSRSDWNRIAEITGDASWRANEMERYYARVREWLSLEIPDPSLAIGDTRVSSYLTAAAETYADRTELDPLGTGASVGTLLRQDVNQALLAGETTGVYRLPLATANGRRNGTRERIVTTVSDGFPLTVITGAFVTRVLWEANAAVPTAIGVEYVRGRSVYGASLAPAPAPAERVQAFANAEVVISAGTFNTPQLLMLSGVGDPEQLTSRGIAPVVPSPGVGLNLQDRYEAPVVTQFAQPLDVVARCRLGQDPAGDPCVKDWKDHQGVYQTPGFLASVLLRSSASEPLADLQVFAVPTDARGYYPGYSKDSAAAKNRFTWLLLKAHTKNHDGTVRLVDKSPFSRPDIAFNSYDEKNPLGDPDLLALVRGIQFVRRIEDRMQTLVPGDRVEEVWPGPTRQSDADLAAWIRKESWGHHACGTSKMGQAGDPTAVVDAQFRVHGARRLRVVDASVFPEIPGTFIALPTYMIAEKAADAILGGTP